MQCLKPDPNARYSGIMDAFVKIVKNEGVTRPVRGMGIVAFGAGPAHALYFSCYEFIKKNFSGSSRPGENPLVNGIAGCFATLLHDAVMVPSDVIKQRLQMYNSPYKGIIDCVMSTKRKEGLSAFYRSYFTQLNMNIPYQVTLLLTYYFIQSHITPNLEYNPLTHWGAGALAGATAAALTTPLDVCKTLINTQECCNPEENCKTQITKMSPPSSSSSCSSGATAANAAQTTTPPPPPSNSSQTPSSKVVNQAKSLLLTNHQTAFASNTIRNQSTSTLTRATGLLDAVKIIYRVHGYKGFFRGVMPRVVFQIPGTAVSWSVYEYFKHILKSKHQHID